LSQTDPPPAQGVRLEWASVPTRIRQEFEGWAGSRVISATSQPSGFSPGVAARLKLEDGRGLFVKAVSSEPNADSPAMHRREARVLAALPSSVPVPRLRWFYDSDGWVILVLDEAHGRHPRQPWDLVELDQVLAACAQLAQRLTPTPVPVSELGSASDRLARRICGWRRLLDDPPEIRAGLDAWSRRHLEALADLESRAPAAVSGDTLLHFDLRADNLLLGAEHVWFVDWPHACVGAAWFDVVAFVPSVTMQGGPSPEDVFARYPAGKQADAEEVTRGVAAVAGFFIRESLLPPPPGLPTLRAFQAAQGMVARQWLAQRTRLE
jgi:aminoglycoside phosphotransferase (APT) family kinase protein